MVEQPELFTIEPMAPNAKTQCADVLEYLRAHGSITQMDAIREFNCTRLAARIYDLCRAGYQIKTEQAESTNWRGKTVRFARYRMAGGQP